MTSIDQRIVELKFDASKFRSGIQAAIVALDNLKKNLNMDKAAKEFDKVEKASKNVTFSDLYTSVDSISDRFSSFGIVGMTVLSNLTNTAVNAGKRILSALTDPLIAGGKRRALNIEQAKFQITGLGYTWEQVEADINYGVKDTAYGLDAAAKACSQLLASQVQVGDQMKASLRGISGVAAMTSSEYEDISSIFTTVAGQGKLMTDQLNQLASRGLNAAATLANYLGVTEAEVREMTSKGEIDFQTFANAMDSAFGEHAKKANETFTGSLSNMKAALSRIGAKFATPAYQKLRDVFNSLTPVIDGVSAALDPLVKTAENGMAAITNFITTTLGALGKEGTISALAKPMEQLNQILNAFGSTAMGIAKLIGGTIVPILKSFVEIIGPTLLDAIGGALRIISSFMNSLVFTDTRSKALTKTFANLFTIVNILFKAISKVVSFVASTFFKVFSEVLGFVLDVILTITSNITSLVLKIHDMVVNLYNLETVQGILTSISKVFEVLGSIVSKVYFAFTKLVGILLNKAFDYVSFVFSKIASVLAYIGEIVDKVKNKILELVDRFRKLDSIQRIASKLSETFAKIKDISNKLIPVLKTIFFDIFAKIKQIIENITDRFRALSEVFKNFVNLFIDKAFDYASVVLEKIDTALSKMIEFVKNAITVIREMLDRFKNLQSIQRIITNVKDAFSKVKSTIEMLGSTLKEKFINIFDMARSSIQRVVDLLHEKFVGVFEVIKRVVDEIAPKLQDLFEKFKTLAGIFLDKAFSTISTYFDKMDYIIVRIQKTIDNVIRNVLELIEHVKNLTTVKTIVNLISDSFERVKTIVEDVGSTIKTKFFDVIDKARTVVDKFSSKFNEKFIAVFDKVKDTLDTFNEKVNEKFPIIVEKIQSAVEKIVPKLRELFDGFMDLVDLFVDKAFAFIIKVIDKIDEALMDMGTFLKKVIDKVVSLIDHFRNLEIVQRIVSRTVELFDRIKATIEKVSIALRDKFVNIFNEASRVFSDFGSNLKTKVVEVLEQTHGRIDKFAEILKPKFIDLMEKAKTVTANLASNLKTKFADALDRMRQAIEAASPFFQELRDRFGALANAWLDKAFEGAAKALDVLDNALIGAINIFDIAISKIQEFIDYLWHLPQVEALISSLKETFDKAKTSIVNIASIITKKLGGSFDIASQKLGYFIWYLKDKLGGGFQNFIWYLKIAINAIKEFVKQLDLPSLSDIAEGLKNIFTDILEKGIENFTKIIEVIGDVFSSIKDLTSISLKGIIENFGKLRDRIVDIVNISERISFIKDIFIGLRDGVLSVSSGLTGGLTAIKDKIVSFVDWIKSYFDNINIGNIMAAGIGGSFIVFLIQATKLMGTLDQLAGTLTKTVGFFEEIKDSLVKILNNVSKVIKNVGNLAKAKADAIRMDAITNIIKAVVLLAGAIAILATMDPERVKSSAEVLLVLATALIGLATAMAWIERNIDPAAIVESTGSMIAIAGSLLVLVLALKLLSTVPMDDIGQRLIVLGALMLELGALTAVLSKLAPEMSKESVSIIAISLSLLLLVGAIQRIGEIEGSSINSAMGVLIVLVGFLALLTKVSSKAGLSIEAAVSLVGIVIAIRLLINTLDKLADINSGKLTTALSNLIKIVGTLALLLLATRAAGNNAIQASAALLLITVAMNLMYIAIKNLSSIDNGMLSQATKSINEILKVFALITVATKLAGQNGARAGLAILQMSAAMLIISAAIILIGRLSKEEIERATDAITQVLLMFALIVAATSVMRSADKTMTMIAVTIGVLAGALAVLALIQPENLLAASSALSMLMGMFATIVVSTGYATKAKATVLLMLGVVGGLSLMLYGLAQLPFENTLAAAASLSALLISLSASAAILQFVDPKATLFGVLGLIEVVAGVGLLLTALGGLTYLFPDLQQWLSDGIPILQAVGEGLGAFAGGLLSGALGATSGMLPILGENLSSFMNGLQDFVKGAQSIDDRARFGIETLAMMILAITAASVIDGINLFGSISGTMDEFNEGLPKMAEGFKGFAENIAGMDTGTVENTAKSVGIIMNVISQVPTSGGLLGWIMGGSDLGALANSLPKFGDALREYSYSIAGMDTGSVINTERAAQIIIELTNSIPSNAPSVLGFFTGGSDIDKFASSLPKFGDALREYSYSIAGMDTGSVYNTEQACKIIMSLTEGLPNTYGGLAGLLTGGTSIDDFVNVLPKFGEAFYNYADKIGGMDTDSVYNTEQACRMIIALADTLPNTYQGLAGLFTGGTFVDDFGSRLPILAHGFFMYAENIGGMDTGSIANTDAAVRMIVDITKYVGDSANFLESINRDISMVDLSANLPVLAHAFFMYAQNIAGMDTGSVENTDTAIRRIIDISKYVGESASIFGAITRDINMIDLSTNLPMLAHAFFMYAQNIGGMDTGSVENSATAIDRIVETVKLVATSSLTDSEMISVVASNLSVFSNGYKTFGENVSTIDFNAVESAIYWLGELYAKIQEFPPIDSAISNFDSFINALKTAGSQSVEAFVTALQNGSVSAGQAAYDMMNYAVNQAKQRAEQARIEFMNYGKLWMQALATGIRTGSSMVTAAIASVASSAVSTLSGYYSQFVSAGEYFCSGVSQGISNGYWWPINNVGAMGDDMVARLRDRLGIASPAKEGIAIGKFWDQGVALGVIRYTKDVLSAIDDSSDQMLDRFNSGKFLPDLDLQPIITPELDTSLVDKGIDALDARLSSMNGVPVSVQGSRLASAFANVKKAELAAAEIQNGTPSQVINNYDMTQNNYSPKALSRIDIYRKTNAQFSRLRGVTNLA